MLMVSFLQRCRESESGLNPDLNPSPDSETASDQGCAGVTIPVRESGTRDIPDFFPVRSGNPGEIREFLKTNLKRLFFISISVAKP